jgi:hypothetical protein
MAKHTEASPKTPGVRFERTDINDAEVTYWGIGFAAVALLGSLFAVWVSMSFIKPPPGVPLPPAAIDGSRRPPEPRLEALEDLETRRPRLFPPRAAEHRAAEEALLKNGGPGVLPILKVFREIKIPSSGGKPAPTTTPSRATAGREVKEAGR